MTKLEELQVRLKKIEQFWTSLPDSELYHISGGSKSPNALSSVIGEEMNRLEFEIARIRLSEFLDIDKTFEKEVLDADVNR